ncbi:NADPH-dependent ferric siderophore reductase [Conyzicola nivalis]|uniref:NADPH-dependent ferric siderophore reductase n=1 Tax=Conyzicola nivalis TaxID=1477021 RepID=A0ABV2QPF3_9MICO
MTTQTPRPARSQIVLSVVRTEWLTPRMVRVVAGGAGFDDLIGNEFTDKYTKVIFVKPELGLEPPYDLTALRESLPQHDWPVVRTYTIRRIDSEAREVVIDFVVHGTEGVAGPWAAGAVAGDTLVLGGAGGAYAPRADTGWHVLAGDESAIPAIASALEAMPEDARGVAHIEVDDDTDVQLLTAPAGVILNWILRDGARTPDLLATAVDDAEWPEGVDAQVFAHGEREAMKAVRAVLARRGIPRDRFSLSGYWAYGRTEDRFQAEKREPIGVIAD